MDVIEAIMTRRSPAMWSDRPVPREMIVRLLEAAVTAPNHHLTQPWRFFVLTGSAREQFGDALADAKIRRTEGTDINALKALALAERAKPLRAPVLVVVACKHTDNSRIMPSEDLQACAASIQNMLLAAHGLGLAAQWKTGDGVYDSQVKWRLGLDPGDEIAGVVYLGYPAGTSNRLTKRPDYAEHTIWLDSDIPPRREV